MPEILFCQPSCPFLFALPQVRSPTVWALEQFCTTPTFVTIGAAQWLGRRRTNSTLHESLGHATFGLVGRLAERGQQPYKKAGGPRLSVWPSIASLTKARGDT